MFKIGCHMSFTGYYDTLMNALKIGCNTFQYFSRNPRGSSVRKLDLEDINKFNLEMDKLEFIMPLVHAPYTLNPCSKDPSLREFTVNIIKDDLNTLELLNKRSFYNIHPGNHVGQGETEGIKLTAEVLNKAITKNQKTIILLETMSGKGSEIGKTFNEIKQIIDLIECKDKIGVCLDTCHVFSAGYDIINDLDGVLDEFDRIIGLDKLYAIHLNDSKMPFNSHKDRHEKIGLGEIKIDAIKNIINHPKLRNLPFYLETPNKDEGYKEEILMLKSYYK